MGKRYRLASTQQKKHRRKRQHHRVNQGTQSSLNNPYTYLLRNHTKLPIMVNFFSFSAVGVDPPNQQEQVITQNCIQSRTNIKEKEENIVFSTSNKKMEE
ncbi:hypothetical protein YC2023_037509 [Brassica napus]